MSIEDQEKMNKAEITNAAAAKGIYPILLYILILKQNMMGSRLKAPKSM
jgi:hypothetical protein